ncbi:MAG: hypothetical protein MJ208_01015 [Bacilli bacterium]|nr:hypothetical protein [Bacilli bacterium]
MTKSKKESRSINKALYEIRIKKELSLKDASKKLAISKLHLDLIEKGYLKVSNRLEPRFIKEYHLAKDFFDTHSTYIEPTNNVVDNPEATNKFRKIVSSLKARIIMGVLAAGSIATLIGGILTSNKIYNDPQEAWTEKFKTLRNAVLTDPERDEQVDILIGDTYYVISNTSYEGDAFETYVYEKELNAQYTSFKLEKNYDLSDDKFLEFKIVSYNKRIIAFTDFINEKYSVEDAVCFIEGKDNFNLRSFTYKVDEEIHNAEINDPTYNELNTVIKQELGPLLNKYNENVLAQSHYGYTDIYEATEDIRKISYNYVYRFDLGYDLKITGGIILSIVGCCLILSFIIKPKIKLKIKHKNEPAVQFSIAGVSLPARDLPNDTKFPLVMPEFALRIIGLVAILLFAIGLNIATNWRINGNLFEKAPENIVRLQELSSSFLVIGTTLIFFLKMDLFYKKTTKELLTNIFVLFVFGLVYYTVEVTIYMTFATEYSASGTVLGAIMSILTMFLPGNIIWNLMLYSCIFYFLFTTPKRMENYPHKIMIFRLYSLIPTLLLLLAFIFKMFIEPKVDVPYYISCIFFTKGILITLFAITYLYALYFLELYYRFRFGDETAKVYFYSKRFALVKNMVACVIIAILFLIDVYFMYKMPDNRLNLGTNWPIIFLVPIIFFYRPHIGKRNKKWDTAFTLLFILFLAGGFIATISQVSSLFDFSQLREILN